MGITHNFTCRNCDAWRRLESWPSSHCSLCRPGSQTLGLDVQVLNRVFTEWSRGVVRRGYNTIFRPCFSRPFTSVQVLHISVTCRPPWRLRGKSCLHCTQQVTCCLPEKLRAHVCSTSHQLLWTPLSIGSSTEFKTSLCLEFMTVSDKQKNNNKKIPQTLWSFME